jgi:hypothetical protein
MWLRQGSKVETIKPTGVKTHPKRQEQCGHCMECMIKYKMGVCLAVKEQEGRAVFFINERTNMVAC